VQSWNPTGPTRTPTLGMRLSCNFVNVYTIVYHVQYTYTCTRAHPQRTSSRGKARVSDKSPRTSRRGSSCVSGSWRAERGPRQADFRARILSVLVSMSVPWNLSLTQREGRWQCDCVDVRRRAVDGTATQCTAVLRKHYMLCQLSICCAQQGQIEWTEKNGRKTGKDRGSQNRKKNGSIQVSISGIK